MFGGKSIRDRESPFVRMRRAFLNVCPCKWRRASQVESISHPSVEPRGEPVAEGCMIWVRIHVDDAPHEPQARIEEELSVYGRVSAWLAVKKY